MKQIMVFLIFIFSIQLNGQYKWSNPTPAAGKLYGINFIDSLTGWIVGENSTALKTTDSGNSWTPQKIPIWSTLRKIKFIDKNFGWIIGGDEEVPSLGAVLLTTDGGDNWSNYNPEPQYGWNDLCVLSRDLIFIGGFTGVYKSTDGGYNWIKIGGTNWTTTVFFIDELHGWFGNTVGDIYQTTDGGVTWNKCHNMKNTWHKSIRFINSKVGYLASGMLYSNEGKIYKSINGGTTWILQDSIHGREYKNLVIRDSLNVTAFGEKGLIKYTTDGGNTWFSSYAHDMVNDAFYDIADLSSKSLMVGGSDNYGRIFYGSNNSSWEEMSKTYTKSGINCIDFIDKDNGICVGDGGTILKTSDSGESWSNINVFSMELSSISYFDQTSIFIAGRMGEFIKSTDGGASWNISYALPKHNEINMKFFSKTLGYAFLQYESLKKTTDSGENWIDVGNPYCYNFFFVDSLNGWMLSNPLETYYSIIYHTIDGGSSWTSTKSSNYISEIFFIDKNNGWINCGNRLYKSSDGGTNWELVNNTFDFVINKMVFISKDIGFALTGGTSRNSIMVTTDGGQTFNSIIDYTLLTKIAIGNNKIWAFNEYGQILEIDTDKYTDVKENQYAISTNYILEQNYPNPFNPITHIKYKVPSNSYIKLKIYDVLGRIVHILVNEYQFAGNYEVTFNASGLSSGVYFYMLEANNFIETKKLLLLK